MTKKVVRYTLTPEGNIPEFISNGGYFPNNFLDGSPMIGITVDNPSLSEDTLTFETTQDLVTYLNTYTEGSVVPKRPHSMPIEMVPFDPQEAAQAIFDFLNQEFKWKTKS